jgi:molybdenum transport protein
MLRALSDEALQQLLREDAPFGDVSTMSLGLGAQAGRVVMAARQPMTVCGSEEAARLFELHGATATVHAPSGSHGPVLSCCRCKGRLRTCCWCGRWRKH